MTVFTQAAMLTLYVTLIAQMWDVLFPQGRGSLNRWTVKMFKFDSENGVLSYCDAKSWVVRE